MRSKDFLSHEMKVMYVLFQQLAAVHLVDSHHCSDPTKFISVLLTSLSTMIHVELPHVNVLSKIDLVEQYGKLGTVQWATKIHVIYTILEKYDTLFNLLFFFVFI